MFPDHQRRFPLAGLSVHDRLVSVGWPHSALDTWKERELKSMAEGGNDTLVAFLKERGVPADLSIEEKYITQAAEQCACPRVSRMVFSDDLLNHGNRYRQRLRAIVNGEALPPTPIDAGRSALSAISSSEARCMVRPWRRRTGLADTDQAMDI